MTRPVTREELQLLPEIIAVSHDYAEAMTAATAAAAAAAAAAEGGHTGSSSHSNQGNGGGGVAAEAIAGAEVARAISWTM